MTQLDELRQIIVGDNSEQLAELQKRIDNVHFRTKDVAEVLAPAIEQGLIDGEELINALQQPVSASLKMAIRTEPTEYADILYPAIAPSIRLAISQAISSMLATINQSVTSATSVSGMKMRFDSMRLGIPYAELALRKSLLYRVERLYLIERDSGLMIAECAAKENAGSLDSDAVSAMFSAIQSFVQDSFSGKDSDRLTDFKVGDHTVWLAHGPKAMLACVILGNAPQELKTQLHQSLELIRLEYADQISHFDGDAVGFEGVEARMRPLLQMQLKEEEKPQSKMSWATKIILLGLIGLLGYIGAVSIDKTSKINTVQYYLATTPGIVPTEVFWQDEKITVRGLQDPQAQLPLDVLQRYGIGADDLQMNTKAYRSLESELESRRSN